MKKILLFFCLNLIVYSASAQYFGWANAAGGTGDMGQCMVTDAAGNVYTGGIYKSNPLVLGSYSLPNADGVGQYEDIYIAKFSPAGAVLWAKRLGGTSVDFIEGICLDNSDNILISGSFSSATLAVGSDTLTNAGGHDAFVAKMDQSGNFLWARQMNNGAGDEYARGITTDNSGNVYTTGSFRLTVDFDPGTPAFNMTSAGGGDIFIWQLDANGAFVWAKQMGDTAEDVGRSIVIDNQGFICSAGYFQGTVDFDPDGGTVSMSSLGDYDIYVHKLDNTGYYHWVKTFGGTAGDFATVLKADAQNNLYTTGGYTGTVDFDPGASSANYTSNAGSHDVYISKLDAFGNYVWSRGFGGVYDDRAYGMDLDNAGNVYATGYFLDTLIYPSSAITLVSNGGYDVFITKTDANGNLVWGKSVGASSMDAGSALSVDGFSNVYSTGYFQNTVDFDPSAGIAYSSASGASPATYVLKLIPTLLVPDAGFTLSSPVNTNISCYGTQITFNDTSSYFPNSWLWDFGDGSTSALQNPTHVYASTGNYTISLVAANVNGSDTAFYNLTVNALPVVSISGTTTICAGQSSTLTASGATSYSWSTGGGTSSSIVVSPSVTTQYIVTGTVGTGCAASDTISVTVNALPVVSFIAGSTACLNETIPFTDQTTTGGSIVAWNWNFGDGNISTVQNPAYAYTGAGSYNVQLSVTDNNGCAATSSPFALNVLTLPTITAGPASTTICTGSNVPVTLTASGGMSYSWSPGGLTTAAVNVLPATTTTYTVTGTDANGCANTASATVNVNMVQSLFQGNVFFKDNGTPVNITSGKVYIYNVDSVGWIGATDSATIGTGGSFDMGTVPFGNYKAYIVPDVSYTFLANTYYNLKYTWDDAGVISFTCADTTFLPMELDSISPLPAAGGVTLGGVILADSSFTGKTTVQGDPVPGVDVALEQNPGSVMLATTTTDANGLYTFNNVPLTPAGYHYTIIANIPGFGLDSSYNIVVTGAETELNYFVSDSTIYIDSAMSAIYTSVKHINKINENIELKAYPNPYSGSTNIVFELKQKSNVLVEVFNTIGQKVAVLDNTIKDAGICRYTFSAKANGGNSGVYFVKIKIDQNMSVLKLMEME